MTELFDTMTTLNKYILLFLFIMPTSLLAQIGKVSIPAGADSIKAGVHPSYNNVVGFHRMLFGENYRKDWAIPVTMPVLRISKLYGGLTPVREGGGMQSRSLRLTDASGKEWVLRSVEKIPDKVVPENLRGTFVVDWVGDEFSGQEPFSALVVPPLAKAARVPYTNPVIGVVADDPALGRYGELFTGMICLVEERDPAGPSDNTIKFKKELMQSYDARFDGEQFLRARLLDLLLGDWDRHEDQWRWAVARDGNARKYIAVPRDRDQVFHINNGLFPWVASLPWINPALEDYDPKIPRVKYSFFKTRFMKAYPDAQISYSDWMRVTNEFVNAETDEVLEEALKRLPAEIYQLRHDELYAKLRERRNSIPRAMDEYYRFIYRIADLRLTDKAEKVTITDGKNKGLRVLVEKLVGRGAVRGMLMDLTYDPRITAELRLYTSGGNDQVIIDAPSSPVKLRIVDSSGTKKFNVRSSARKVHIYGSPDSSVYGNKRKRISLHLSTDTSATKFIPTDPYNVWMPLATANINRDDGFLFGLGFRYTGHDGFRKPGFSTIQQVMLTHSFSTNAFSIAYNGQWREAVGKADLMITFLAQAPDNTQNFFGQGNNTRLDKSGDYRRFYRSRYNVFHFDPALRWNTGSNSTLTIGPSVQYYHFNEGDNIGRSVTRRGLVRSYDSTSYQQQKLHAGLVVNFLHDRRNNTILPSSGYLISAKLQAYAGVNGAARSFAQFIPTFTVYGKIDQRSRLVISDRIGGGISVGEPGFYQSMYLGGQGNLLGYLKNRFAGEHMVYNNFQARLRIANLAGYILPGQLGLTGFFDTGRVWQSGENSNSWHHGKGGGFYFSPAGLGVVQLLAGHSTEGWYPYISLNYRL
jgi:hypothetical protein